MNNLQRQSQTNDITGLARKCQLTLSGDKTRPGGVENSTEFSQEHSPTSEFSKALANKNRICSTGGEAAAEGGEACSRGAQLHPQLAITRLTGHLHENTGGALWWKGFPKAELGIKSCLVPQKGR